MATRTRLEDAFQGSEELFHALLDNVVDGMVIIDHNGIIQAYNRAAEEIFGHAGQDVLGQSVGILMPASERKEHEGNIARYLNNGDARIIGIGRELVGLRKDGTEFPMDLSVGEIPHGDAPFFVGIVRDLSERKQREENLRQMYKMEALGQLTGGVAHDFNNLLAVLMMDLELLEDHTRGRPEEYELVAEAREVAQAGAELTQQLLAFSRRQPLDPKSVDLATLVRGLASMLRRTLGDGIEIDTVMPGSLWRVMVDPGQLENAVLNLALNARDAMPGGGRLTIAAGNATVDGRAAGTYEGLEPGEYVFVSVSDTGTGMTHEVLDRAFEPFFSTKDKASGTGLGLSMVFGFASQSGGHASISSSVGDGTVVKLMLPRGTSEEVRETPHRDARKLPRGSETILLVEDHDRLRGRGIRTLQDLGYHVIDAANGQEALMILDQGREVDLLFTDVIMPGGMTGSELADRAHEMRPGLKVLFTTGYAEHLQLPDSEGPDLVRILTKPYSRLLLAQTIRDVLDSKP